MRMNGPVNDSGFGGSRKRGDLDEREEKDYFIHISPVHIGVNNRLY